MRRTAVSVKEFDSLVCEVVRKGWTTRYDAELKAYVVITDAQEEIYADVSVTSTPVTTARKG